MSLQRGKLVVIEGIDGSGKSTQIELLKKYFQEKNIPFEAISFPQYGKNEYADKIYDYLLGKFGESDPYSIAKAYAADRKTVKDLINNWLESGKLVIANRYVSSSKAHLGANISSEKRAEFMRWVGELEYRTNGIPKPDLTILLDVDPKIGQQNVLDQEKPDIHEKSIEHESEAAKIYLELSQAEENWVVLDCMEGNQMKSAEEIHQKIVEILKSKIL